MWEKWESSINKIVNTRYLKEKDRKPIIKRHEFLLSLKPTEVIRWVWGFNEYLAYRFPNSNMTILESIEYWNAIYVLWNDWEILSQLSKKEILSWGYSKERIIHEEKYFDKLKKYFI